MIRRMPARAVGVCAALLWTASAVGQAQSSQAAHIQIFFAAHLRMFDVTVPAGGMKLDHSHDRDVVIVALGDSMVRTRGAGEPWSAPLDRAAGSVQAAAYTGAPAAHALENVGRTPYRAFVVENLREGGWSRPRLIEAPATRIVEESRAFSVYDVRLTPATPRTNHVHDMPTLVMLISGTVEVQGGGGESAFRMDGAGRWFPSMWGQPHTLSLVGADDARLVEVEAR